MAEARQVKNRIVQAVLRECQKLKEKDDLTDELEHVRDIKNKIESKSIIPVFALCKNFDVSFPKRTPGI